MKLKNYLGKAVVVGAVAVATMVVGSVSAFAADYTSGKVDVSADKKTKTWEFTTNLTATTIGTEDNVHGIKCTEGTVQIHASDLLRCNADSAIAIPVPTNSVGTINLANQSTVSDERYASVEGGTAKKLTASNDKDKGQDYSFTAENTADGYIDVSFTGGVAKIAKIEVTLNSGEFETIDRYTATGTCTGLSSGTEFKLTNITDSSKSYTATVGADGSYTIEDTSEIVEGTYTASLNEYAVSYADDAENVTIAGENITPAITFEKLTLKALENGEYDKSKLVLPNFEGKNNGTAGKYNGNATIKFILASKSVVTINSKCGSSSSSKKVKYTLGGKETSEYKGGDGWHDEVFTLDAGEHTIEVAETDTSLEIKLITVEAAPAEDEAAPKAVVKSSTDNVYEVSLNNVDTSEEQVYIIKAIKVVADGKNDQAVKNIKVNDISNPTEFGFSLVVTGTVPADAKIVVEYEKNGTADTTETALA